MENIKENKKLKIASSKKIKYMDGVRLNRAIIAGIRYLISRQDHLNKINVFPVPDGDTGTNMSFTMSSILEVCIEQKHHRIDDFTRVISEAAIDGARGNSGVLIAQFFVGFAEACEKQEKLDYHTLGKAFQNGSISARDAMEDPREGTILTVFQDLADEINSCINEGLNDIYEIMKKGYSAALQSLEDTPQKLKILKKAGVVDAGAQGFVDFLTGMMNFIKDGSVKNLDISNLNLSTSSKHSESGAHHLGEEID